MSLPVVLRPEASRDVEEARNYLESQQEDLGQSYLDRLNETLAQISAQPELCGVVWRNIRAARVRRFVYVVYYRIQSDRIEVLAVMHGSRDGSGWQSRV